jgi:hypothetical protein
MESKLKAACMESVGELPADYIHLPTTPIKQAHVTNIWLEHKTYHNQDALQIIFSNGYQMTIICGFSSESISRAFQDAAKHIDIAERNGLLRYNHEKN